MEKNSCFWEAMEKAEKNAIAQRVTKARTWLAKNLAATKRVGITTMLKKAFRIPIQAALDLVRRARG